MKKLNVYRFIILLVMSMLITSCLSKSDNAESFSIIIPPGDQVKYNTDEFLTYSDDNYTAVVRRVGATNDSLLTLIDVTPEDEDKLLENTTHRTIVPKGSNLEGFLILHVDMEYHETQFYGFVYDSDTIVKPDFFTSLTYELLANYDGRPMNTYSQSEIEKIEAEIKSIVLERMDLFELDFTINLDILYKFFKNSLSSNYEFLTFMQDFDVNFDFDSSGDVGSAPYPFGEINNPPILNELVSTPQGQRNVLETTEIQLEAQAIDPDGDLVFYLWNFNTLFHDSGTTNFYWTPDYTHGREETYPVTAFVSDGGQVLEVNWDLKVTDLNRPPVIEVLCTDLTVAENNEFVCNLTGSDPGNDVLTWSLAGGNFSGAATLNGQPEDVESVGDTAELRFTPNNGDAKRKLVNFEIHLDDGKGGVDVQLLLVNVSDTNTAPIILSDTIEANLPSEWDHCLEHDPTDDSEVYTFDVVLQDPDNVAGAFPPDIISLSISGRNSQDIKEVGVAILDPIAHTLTFKYEWQPDNNTREADVNFRISDDHGAIAPIITKNLVAKDINQRACMTTITRQAQRINRYPDEVLRRSYRIVHRGRDNDGDLPLMVMSNINLEILPQQTQYHNTNPVIARQRFDETELTVKTKATTRWIGYRTYAQAPFSGLLRLTRSTEGGAPETLPKGFKFNLVESSTGHFIEYETADAVTIAENEHLVVVPVKAINRSVPKDHLTVIAEPLTDSTITVTHSAFTGLIGEVTLSRPANGSGVMIPEDTPITNAPGTTSFEYKVAGDFFMASDQTSVTVPVRRFDREFPAGSEIEHDFNSTEVSLDLPLAIHDDINYTIHPYKNLLLRRYDVHAYEGADTEVDEINEITGALASTNLMVRNPKSFVGDGFQYTGVNDDFEFGEVEFSRPVTAATSIQNIPAGTTLESSKGNKYETIESASLEISEESKLVKVKRILEQSWNEHNMYYYFWDYNHRPLLASEDTTAIVQEGGEITNFLIEVKDGVNPDLAMDPQDRYTFDVIPQIISPVAPVYYCRNRVANFADSTDPSTCTPCDVLQPGIKYHGSRYCYLNFRPNELDLAETYALRLEVDDHGYLLNPRNSNKSTFNINLSIVEQNEAPALAEVNGNSPTSAGTLTDPIIINQPFIENRSSPFEITVTDSDKTFDLKKIGFNVISVHTSDNTSTPISPMPTGITVTVQEEIFDDSGIGSVTKAAVNWIPTDEDIKNYTNSESLIIGIEMFDNIFSSDSERLKDIRYFQVNLQNVNNLPGFAGLSDTLTPVTNSYYSTIITVNDSDNTSTLSGSFQTSLSLCKDKFGAPLVNTLHTPPLDDGSVIDPIDCHAHPSLWGANFTNFDDNYVGNIDVPECRTIDGESSLVNRDLAIPKFTRVNGPYELNGNIAYDYKIEWCPQDSQIGAFGIDLILNDNGDEDGQGDTLSPKAGTVSLLVNVISPVFFESPKLSLKEVPDSDPVVLDELPDHFIVQTTTRGGEEQFNYPLHINNSKKNPLEVTLLDAPRDCTLENGACIIYDEVLDAFSLQWTPKFPDDLTDATNPDTWHLITLKVVDTVTFEEDIVYFNLQVNPPTTNVSTPIINTFTPADNNSVISELDELILSVEASDADKNPSPVLHYSWYIDNQLIYDRGPSYVYIPDKNQGGIDPDGDGPLKTGQHSIRVVVTDGNFTTEKDWLVQVKNTFMVPDKIFDLVEQRKEVDDVTVTNVNLSLELPFEETVFGAGSTQFHFNHLLFSGSYRVGVVTKRFMWDLKFFEGKIRREQTENPWSLYEDLPWRSGTRTEQLSYYNVGSQVNFLASSQRARSGPYSTTQDAVRLSGNFNTISSPLAGGFRCSGSCASNLYTGEKSYGHRLSQKWGSYLFWVDDISSHLRFDFNGGNLLSVVNLVDFESDGSDDVITGLSVNDSLKRLYIASTDFTSGSSYVHIYDLSPLGANTSDSGSSVPTLIESVQLSLPGIHSGELASPTDMVIDTATNTVYTFLSGVGGVLAFTDTGSGAISLTADNYLGLDDISASPGDQPSSGQRLIFNNVTQLAMGVSRQGNQIFTINPSDSNKVSVHSFPLSFDSIMTYEQSGLSLVLSRDAAQVFELK